MTVKPIKFGTGRQLTELAYAQTLADFFSHYDQVPHIQNKIRQVQQVVQQINRGYLPPQFVDPTITEGDIDVLHALVLEKYPNNPALGNQYWQQVIEPLESLDEVLANVREVLIDVFDMYSYVNNGLVYALDEYLGESAVLEIMAGHGYLGAGLRAISAKRDMYVTDDQSWHAQPGMHTKPVTDVQCLDALEALKRYAKTVEFIIMSWAPDTDEIDWQVLQWVRQYAPHVQFLVIGEQNGATNSTRFWQEAELTPIDSLNQHLKSFDLIDEKIYLVR